MVDETAPLPAGDTGPDLPDPFPGELRLLRCLGRGGFGEVWLADDLSPLARQVALKFLRPAPTVGLDGALAVLRNEARLLASLDHPNIVKVHAWRQPTGLSASLGPCLVLQYVAGGSLEDRVARAGPLPWPSAARYVADVADGLLQAHRRGIVHRDVKPANILWATETDEALLTDFGVAAHLGGPPSLAGTALFMAPEAFDGAISPALDVYGLAATLFWLVTAEHPFRAFATRDLVNAARAGLPTPDPRCAGLPAALEELLRAGLSASPERRPALADFSRSLRGGLNQLLADALTLPAPASSGKAPVNLRLLVSRRVPGRDTFVPLAGSVAQPERAVRDFKRVPQAPERVVLHTGDRVHLEVVADRPGHVVVFNVGPTGNLNLLAPADLNAPPPRLDANVPLHVLDVELTPPTGHERLFALWTRGPLPLRLEELRSLVEQGAGPYRATRDMVRVQASLQQLSPEERRAVVLELDHQ